MARVISTTLRATAVTIVVTGIVYPLLVTAIASVAFPFQAGGSLVTGDSGRVVGSDLIGQSFVNPAYVQPRPSAAGSGYDAASSGGSNLGPTSKALRDLATADVARLRAENPGATVPVPAELVTASGSGLDPHLSPESVEWQIPRIAAARHVSEDRVLTVVAEFAEGRDFGFLGEPRVNVLALNLALDRRFGRPAAEGSMSPK
jgi:K+-transporting ATPase ATPase C chain